jgi:hypothetical protein
MTVNTIDNVKTALADAAMYRIARSDPQSGKPIKVGDDVGLSDQGDLSSQWAQVIAHRKLIHAERYAIPSHPVA